MTVGIAVFVKTPSLSPIKTRLAASVGVECALAIYRASVECVRASVAAACADAGLSAYWAVAEPAGADQWWGWPVLIQPEGDLGVRMAGIHAQLLARHRAALLLGADVPGISADTLRQACRALAPAPARVIAPAADGGFVLFGASGELAAAPWSQIAYGAPDTARQFLDLIGPSWPLTTLADHDDLDTLADLHALGLRPPTTPTAAQRAFWAQLAAWQACASVPPTPR